MELGCISRDICVHRSLVSTIYIWWVSVFGNLKVDNVGKYLENFLGVDTVYSNNERSGRQLARVVSMSAELCWSAGEGWMLLLNCRTAHCKSAH